MSPADQFEAWRSELKGELEETQQKLATERARLAAAETAYTEARDAHTVLQQFAKNALSELWDNALAGPLHSRLVEVGTDLKAPESERGAARASVANLEARISQLRAAVNQVDVVLRSAKVSQIRPPLVEPTRRKPQPVDFNDIEMPRGAA